MLKDDVQQAVFIKIVELAEKSEQRWLAPVRSIVGLCSFYPDLRLGAEVDQLPSGHLLRQCLRYVANRELESRGIGRRIKPMILSNGHCIESSIECGSEIVDTVACD